MNCSMYHFVIFIHILYLACTVGLGLRAGNPPPHPPEFIFASGPEMSQTGFDTYSGGY